MTKGGMKEALYEGVNLGEKDFSALVSKIKASGADLVYWGGCTPKAADRAPDARPGRQGRADGRRRHHVGRVRKRRRPGVEGTLMTFAPDPRKRAEAKAIVEKFRAKKFEPEAYTLYSYAAVEIIKQAAEQAKSLDPKKVAEVISSARSSRP
jgi:branched-chain amino acid transport system substrate-binding protein